MKMCKLVILSPLSTCFNTNQVEQIVVGCVDPGKKHKYIVERYLEELFKNLDNVEIVELRELTKYAFNNHRE